VKSLIEQGLEADPLKYSMSKAMPP